MPRKKSLDDQTDEARARLGRVEALYASFLEHLERIRDVVARRRFHELDRALGRSSGFLTSVFQLREDLNLRRVFAILDFLRIDLSELVERWKPGPRLPPSGAGWLAPYRARPHGTSALPYLAELEAWGRDLRIEPDGAASGPDLELLLRVAKENRQTALEMAESSVRGMLALRSDALEPESAARLCRLLAIVADLRRDRGHLDEAIDLFELAFEIEICLDCSATRGFLYRLAAYLLCDLGALDIAALFAKRSLRLALYAPDPEGVGYALFAQAVVLNRSGDSEDAIPIFRASLGYGRPYDHELRFAAHHAIACALLQLGRAGEARTELDIAQTVIGTADASPSSQGLSLLSQSKLELLEAEILALEGDAESADARFRSALEGMGRAEAPLDLVLAALRQVEHLLRTGRPQAARDLLQEVIPLSKELARHRVAEAALLHLLGLSLRGTLDAPAVRRASDDIRRPEKSEARKRRSARNPSRQ